jgi:hypothetical protein
MPGADCQTLSPACAGTKQHDLLPQEMPATYLHRSFNDLVT